MPRQSPSSYQDQSLMCEQQIEIDNLKTIIVALNQKVKSREDVEADLSHMTQNFEESEQARNHLRN